MKNRSKALIVGLSVLCLAIPLSSCGAKWEEVTEFFNGIYTTTDGWEGVSYEYECKATDFYTYTNEKGKKKQIKRPYFEKQTAVYKIDKYGFESELIKKEYKYVNYTQMKDGSYIKTESYSSSNNYYWDSDGIEYNKSIITTKTDEEGTVREEHYEFDRTSSSSSYYLDKASSEISYYIYQATNRTASNLGVVSASVGSKSASWTTKDRLDTCTITIKIDGNYAVNYISREQSTSSTTRAAKAKTTYKKINGGKVSKPSWVNGNHFDDLD